MEKTEKFVHAKHTYEIKAVLSSDRFIVQVFKDGKRANPYNYSINFETAIDMDKKPLDALIELAKADIVNKTWEKYLKAIQELKKSENS